jgi:hypothetical protein
VAYGNWRQTSGWGAIDDPTGVLSGRVLVAVGGPGARAEDYLSTEIGTAAAWTKQHYRVEAAFAWYAATDAHPMGFGALALVARAGQFQGNPALARDCYLAVLDFATEQVSIVRRNSDAETLLLTATLPSSASSRGAKHTFAFGCYGGQTGAVRLTVEVDGAVLGTVGDTDAARLLSGAPGLRAYSGTAYVDDFAVYEVTSTGAAPALWLPSNAATSLAGWWKADAGVTAGGGGAVSAWADQSGNGNNAAQATSGSQPVRVTGAVNSLPAIEFDGVDDFLAVPDANTLDLAATGISVFAVLSPDTYGSLSGQARVSAVVEKAGVATSYRLDLRDEVGANPPAVLAGLAYDNGAVSRSSNNAVPLSRYSILAALAGPNAQGAGLYVNGTSVGAISGTVGADTATALVLGGSAGRYVDGRVAEVVLYSGPLSVADRQRVEGYLAHRYGLAIFLPASHPYRATAPTV